MTKKTILVLGARGMLGNALYSYLRKNESLEVYGTDRKNNTERVVHFDADNFNETAFIYLTNKIKPDYILNAIGVIRPGNTQDELTKTIKINAVFPRQLSQLCIKFGVRLVHFSTDCVFDGAAGKYSHTDLPNEKSIYGVSKYLGETDQLPSLTIRTSIVGREMYTSRNLLDWFIGETEKTVAGYTQVYWNGITTLAMSKVVERIICSNPEIDSPLIQLCSNTVSKYDLLHIFKKVFAKEVEIIPDSTKFSDKTLVPSKHQEQFFRDLIPNLDEQVVELADFYKNREVF